MYKYNSLHSFLAATPQPLDTTLMPHVSSPKCASMYKMGVQGLYDCIKWPTATAKAKPGRQATSMAVPCHPESQSIHSAVYWYRTHRSWLPISTHLAPWLGYGSQAVSRHFLPFKVYPGRSSKKRLGQPPIASSFLLRDQVTIL